MRKIRSAIERIDIPAVVAALIAEPLLFAQNIVSRPEREDALANQFLGRAIRRRDEISVPFVFNLQMLVEVMHQQRARFTGDL